MNHGFTRSSADRIAGPTFGHFDGSVA